MELFIFSLEEISTIVSSLKEIVESIVVIAALVKPNGTKKTNHKEEETEKEEVV